MRDDWKTYCLMSAIAYIEEMTKPNPHIQIKKYKDREYKCTCFRSVRLKMKDEEVVNLLFSITRYWESKKGIPLIGKSFSNIRKENFSKQYMFLFTPLWLNCIISECGTIPNKYSFRAALNRINNFKQYKRIPIDSNKKLFNILLKNKKLAAGVFIVSMDLEFHGIQGGRPSLCMSEKFKDFLEFMLRVAQRYNWTNNEKLSIVKVDYSRKLGINASPQFEFRINIKGLQEIYSLAGPLANSHKDKCINFHVNRSRNYINLGGKHRKAKTRDKILEALYKSKDLRSTDLQFVAGVGQDVVLDHLHKLEKDNIIIRKRNGKRFVWNIK